MSGFDYGDANPYDIGSYSPAGSPAAYVPSGPSAGAVGSAPSADITVAPGFTPDYGALLQGDPGLAAAKSAAEAAQQSADAARRAAVRSAYVSYGGGLPSGFTDKYGDIDQAAQDAAKGNQFSQIANLHRNYTQSVEAFKKHLAAMGALQSSELAYGMDSLDRGLGQQEYDLGNSFTNQLAGLYGNYAGVLGQNARDLASAVSGAQANVYNNPANRPVAPTVAHYDTSLSAKYGKPIYTDEWGTVYDLFGNVLQAGTPPPAPAPVAPAAPSGNSGFGGYTDASSGAGYEPAPAAVGGGWDVPVANVGSAAQNVANAVASNPNTTADAIRALQGIAAPKRPKSGYSQGSAANLH